MRKITRTVLAILSGVSILCCITAPIISSIMQSYYKSLLPIANTEEILNQKQFWAWVGETKIFLIIFLVMVGSFLITEITFLLKSIKKPFDNRGKHE